MISGARIAPTLDLSTVTTNEMDEMHEASNATQHVPRASKRQRGNNVPKDIGNGKGEQTLMKKIQQLQEHNQELTGRIANLSHRLDQTKHEHKTAVQNYKAFKVTK